MSSIPLFDFDDDQSRAWDWIRAAQDSGETASAALGFWREQGQSINTIKWYEAWDSYTAIGRTWDTIPRLRELDTVPDDFWLLAPRNFSQQYVAEVHFTRQNLFTGEEEDTYRYIEADYRMSLSEIDSGLDELGMDYIEAEQYSITKITGYRFYQRGSIG